MVVEIVREQYRLGQRKQNEKPQDESRDKRNGNEVSRRRFVRKYFAEVREAHVIAEDVGNDRRYQMTWTRCNIQQYIVTVTSVLKVDQKVDVAQAKQ